MRWKICFFPSGFQGKSSWREGTIPAFQGTTQSPLVVARVSQHKLRWHFISRAQDRSTWGPSGEFLVGSICSAAGLKFEKCWDWLFNWDLGNNMSYFLDVFRQVICLGKAFTLLVCLKLVIVLSALCFFFKIGCFDRCWESLLYLFALTNKKTVMTTRQNFKIYRKTANFNLWRISCSCMISICLFLFLFRLFFVVSFI